MIGQDAVITLSLSRPVTMPDPFTAFWCAVNQMDPVDWSQSAYELPQLYVQLTPTLLVLYGISDLPSWIADVIPLQPILFTLANDLTPYVGDTSIKVLNS